MDAPHYNGGSLDSEQEPSPHDDDCRVCGARYDDVCEYWCDCPQCLRERERQTDPDGEDFRGDEARGYAAECHEADRMLK